MQTLWVDLAGISRSIEKAGQEEGAMASAAAHLLAERAAGLRDALLQVRSTGDGLDADLFLRFPQKPKQR